MLIGRAYIPGDGFARVGGEAATMGEIFGSTMRSMHLVENAFSRSFAMEAAYDARLDEILNATGQRHFNPMRYAQPFDEVSGIVEPADPHKMFQAWLQDLQKQYPQHANVIRADRSIEEDARALARDAEERMLNVWARADGGFGDWATRIAGGFAGMASDPINWAAMMVGPWGQAGAGTKGLLWMGLKSGAANAASEFPIQPFVQNWRKEAGLDYGLDIAATNIAAAGVFGFGLDAGVRSLVRGGRRLAGRPYLGPPPDPKSDPTAALEWAARNAPEGSVLNRAAKQEPEALRELARASGQDEEAAVRGGLKALDAEEIFRGLVKPPEEIVQLPEGLGARVRATVSQTEHDLQLNKATRHAAGDPGAPPPGHAVAAPAAKPGPDLGDSAPARLGATETLEGRPVHFLEVDPAEVITDAATFQFKSEGDVSGVTPRLRGVKRWDPLSAGKAFVFERLDGQKVIADGHQRLGLAKRLADQNPRLHAYVFREADGWTPADVRAHAALKNMRELSGSSLDMAKVMRERPDLIDDSIPLSDGKMREAVMLARLSPEAFDAVVAGRLPPSFAALLGEHVTDAARHAGLLNEIAAADLANATQARFYLRQLMELPTTTETQITLFGEESITRTLMAERSRVLDSSLKTLRNDKRIFAVLDREAGRIEGAGNVLDREGNAVRAQNAAELGELIERLSTTRGVVATLLNDAAISVSNGYSAAAASRAFTRRIGDILDSEGLAGLVRMENVPDELAPGARIDEPGGAEAKAQTANLEIDEDQGIMFALARGDEAALTQVLGPEPPAFDDLLKTFQQLEGGADVRSGPDGRTVDPRPETGGTAVGAGEGTAARSGTGARGGQQGQGGRTGQGSAADTTRAALRTPGATERDEVFFALGEPNSVFDGRMIRRGSYVLRLERGAEWRGTPQDFMRMNIHLAPGIDEVTATAKDLPRRVGYIELIRAEDGRTRVGMVEVMPKHRGSRAAYLLLDTAMAEFGLPHYPDSVLLDPMYRILRRNFQEVRDWWRWWGPSDAWLSPREIGRVLEETRADMRERSAIENPNDWQRHMLHMRRVQLEAVEAIWRDLPDEAKAPETLEKMFALGGGNVVNFPSSGRNGRMVVLNRQIGDISQNMDIRRAEITNIRDKGAPLSDGDEARITQLTAELDELDARLPDLLDELNELETALADARQASGLFEKRAAADDRARKLRYEKADLEKEITGLEETLQATPDDFQARRRLQIANKKLTEVIEAEGAAIAVLADINDQLANVQIDQMFGMAVADSIMPAPWGGTARRAAPTSRFTADAGLRDKILTEARKVLPPDWKVHLDDHLTYGGREVQGWADPKERIVYVSMAALDPLERFYEEAGHALRPLIPEADYDILRQEAKRLGARGHFRIDERYGEEYGRRWWNNPQKLEDALEEEAVMQMVAAHARGRTEPGFQPATPAKRILDRIVKFLRKVYETLTGSGYRRYEDVFGEIVSGEVAARALPETERASTLQRMRQVMFSMDGTEGGAGRERRPGAIRDLINGELAEGRISRDDAQDMLGRLEELEAHYRDNPAQAAQQLADEIDAEALHRQRLRLLAEARQEEIERFMLDYRDERGQPDPARVMIGLLEHHGLVNMPKGFSSAAGRERAIIGVTMARMRDMLAEFNRTRITGRTRNSARLDNVVHELFGEGTGDEEAAAFARIWSEVAEDLRQRFNAAGGGIGHLEGWGLPQSHNRLALLRAGQERWIADITPQLDLGRMRSPLTGNAMTREQLRRSLEWIYREITSDGWHDREASMVRRGLGAVANQRAAHRFLIFRNADSWLNYQASYGSGGNPFVTMMSHLRGMARDIADMETFGPNPRAMLTFMQQLVEKHANQRAAGLPALFPERTKISGREFAGDGPWSQIKNANDYGNAMIKLAEDMYNIRRGHAGAAVNSRVAAVFDALRNLNVGNMLGGAFISAISDISFQRSARAFAGLPQTSLIGDILREFLSSNSRFDAVRAGLILDSAMDQLQDQSRFFGGMQGPAWSRVIADRTLNWSLLQSWTQAGRHAFGKAIMVEFADHAGRGFAELPEGLRSMLQRYGLDASDWDALRLRGDGQPHQGLDLLTPMIVWETRQTAGIADALHERYLEMILQEGEYAVPMGTLQAQARSYGSLRRGVFLDEIRRSAMQFKMFGMTVGLLQSQRIVAQSLLRGARTGAQIAAGLIIGTTVLGGLAIQLKELSRGKDPRPMTDPAFWMAAVLQGGGFGIFGDFLFSESNRFGGGLAETVAGPTVGNVSQALRLTVGNLQKGIKGEKMNVGREAVRFLGRNTPFSSLWYLRLGFERIFLDTLQELADPEASAAWRRRIQMQRRDYGNEFFWRPGELTPRRGPALENVIGS